VIDVEVGRVIVDAFLVCVAGFLTVAGSLMSKHVRATNRAVVPVNGSPALMERVKDIEHTQSEMLDAVKTMTGSSLRLEEHLAAYEATNTRRHEATERRLDDLQSQVAVLVDRRRQDDENMRRYKGPRRRKGE
jgi:hypothetical protein